MLCPCCSKSLSSALVLSPPQFSGALCTYCGFEHFSPAQDSAKVGSAIYEMDPDYADDIALSEFHRQMLGWRHHKVLRFLSKMRPRGIVLDVGCGPGYFVRTLLDRGFNARGLDFNVNSINFGRSQFGLSDLISNDDLDTLIATGLKVDVVCLLDVIEHVDDPIHVVRRATQLLRRNGILAVSTPNKHMCWRPPADYPPHHLSRFTPNALRCLVRNAGLEIVAQEEQMSSFELARNFVGSLFRTKSRGSLRGGAFRFHNVSIIARRTLNALRPIGELSFSPIDTALHLFGVRYVGQLVIARK